MYKNQQYIKLPVHNMLPGKHEYRFHIGKEFFSLIENSEFDDGDIIVDIIAERYSNYININSFLDGELKVICDRCLDEFMIPIEGENRLSIRITDDIPEYNEEDSETEEDIMYINTDEEESDLTMYIYESIYLALPIQRLHADDENGESTCNPDMLKYLNTTGNHTDNSPFAILKNKI